MKRFFFAWALAAVAITAAPPASAAWDADAFVRSAGDLYAQAQAPKGRPGPDRGGPDRGRDFRQDRQEDRRDRMSDDERRSLHRDLDKANRELYGRRGQK